MKLFFKTTNPTTLKSGIIKLIEDGELKTWEIHEDSGEKYLKHIRQWSDKGVIRLTIDNVKMTLTSQVLKFNNVTEDVTDFEGYYLGRFCELMLVNFPDRFTTIIKE